MSRTPVREALIRLESEGLVRIIPSSGTMVTEVSFQNLKDVFEIRSHLIRLAGRLAAARVTREELEAMVSHIRAMEGESDPKTLMRMDLEFHDLLNRATKNEVLVRMLEMLRNQAVRIWTFSRDTDGYYTRLVAELEELVAALKQGDPEESANILEAHTERFTEHVRSQL